LKAAFGPKLQEILTSGAKPPAVALERLGLAELCTFIRRSPEAVRFYRLAFEADETLLAAHGYAAGCVAVQAGEEYYPQALTWLRGYLDGLRGQDPTTVIAALKRWKRSDALVDLDPSLDEETPEDWKKLWADMDALLKRAQEKAK